MNKVNYFLFFIFLLLVLTACNQNNPVESTPLLKDEANPSPNEPVKESKEKELENEKQGNENTNTPSQDQVLMIIDQTQEEPAPPNHFYFSVQKIPDGYSLAKMTWESKHIVTSTIQDAFNYSNNNGPGFYIQGSIPLMGFHYDPAWKGEKGKVTFYFEHDTKEQITWQKTITLK